MGPIYALPNCDDHRTVAVMPRAERRALQCPKSNRLTIPVGSPCLTTVTWQEEEPEQFDFEVALDNWIKIEAPPEKPTCPFRNSIRRGFA
jgi:hypothetical protein